MSHNHHSPSNPLIHDPCPSTTGNTLENSIVLPNETTNLDPHAIPYLPVLDAMLKKAQSNLLSHSLENTAIIYIHHPLLTSINLIEAILRLGAKPKNIFVLGKHYSECAYVVQKIKEYGVYYQPCSPQTEFGTFAHNFRQDVKKMWFAFTKQNEKSNNISKILILDHGGHALSLAPKKIIKKYGIIGIEKTTAGLNNIKKLPPFPLICVANCAAKKFLESPLIAEAIIRKLDNLIPTKNTQLTYAIVGYGSIGQALLNRLSSLGNRVLVHDRNSDQLKFLENSNKILVAHKLSSLIRRADYIFGCSGQDITSNIKLFRLTKKNKTLISCSSEDKEFLTLIKYIQKYENKTNIDPLKTIHYQTKTGGTMNIIRGGFPVNFDNSGESVPANDIQLTRALVLGGILQAIDFFKKPHLLHNMGLYLLDPKIQKFIVSEWVKSQPFNHVSKYEISRFKYLSWIKKNSPGIYEPCDIFNYSFSDKYFGEHANFYAK